LGTLDNGDFVEGDITGGFVGVALDRRFDGVDSPFGAGEEIEVGDGVPSFSFLCLCDIYEISGQRRGEEMVRARKSSIFT
jgi:hypothetical protein